MKKYFMFTLLALFAFNVTFAVRNLDDTKKKDGKQIFLDAKCQTCHTVESVDVISDKKLRGGDLSKVGDEFKADWLKQYLMKEVDLNEKKHPSKALKADDEGFAELVEWLAALKTEKK